jgi:hypothetical protein
MSLIISGCNKSENIETNNNESISTIQEKDDVEDILINVHNMIEEDKTKDEIDRYVFDNIDRLTTEEVDEVVLLLINRIWAYDTLTYELYSEESVQEELINRYNPLTRRMNLSNLGEELIFVQKSVDYGSYVQELYGMMLPCLKSSAFEKYETYISENVNDYIKFLVTSIAYYVEINPYDDYFMTMIKESRMIEKILVNNTNELLNTHDLMDTMYYINRDYFSDDLFEDIKNSYMNKTKLSKESILIYEALEKNASDTLGFKETLDFVKHVKQNNYVVDEAAYKIATHFEACEGIDIFIEDYEARLK